LLSFRSLSESSAFSVGSPDIGVTHTYDCRKALACLADTHR